MFRYSDHTYIVLTLQKLVQIHPEDDELDQEGNGEAYSTGDSKLSRGARLMKRFREIFGVGFNQDNPGPVSLDGTVSGGDIIKSDPGFVSVHAEGDHSAPTHKLRTLQRYHGGPNQERMAFMEAKSALTRKNLAVCAEQVSIFLTSGETFALVLRKTTNLFSR
jgi:hypothetical protein